jgi:hypothetical protein
VTTSPGLLATTPVILPTFVRSWFATVFPTVVKRQRSKPCRLSASAISPVTKDENMLATCP